MTQKELSYLEDAIGHEQNIIKICTELSKNMQNEELLLFINNEINIHNSNLEKLLNLLEVKSNG